MSKMCVKVLEVGGLIPALIGMRLSHQSTDKMDSVVSSLFIYDPLGPADRELALKLIKAGDSHGKFTREIVAWLSVTAPRYWWQEMATYRAGCEVLSASTMHTLKREVMGAEDWVDLLPYFCAEIDEHVVREYWRSGKGKDLRWLKANLPEGFLQERILMVSYQTLRRIVLQRRGHKLPEWGVFIDALRLLPYSELIFGDSDE
jgi:hypothetical protein